VATVDGRTADKNEVGVLMATGGQTRDTADPAAPADTSTPATPAAPTGGPA
jgi:hypothetical protein